MNKIELSIIMPTYNSSHYVEKSISSLIKAVDQKHCEIICIDDGSQDDTLTKLGKLAQENSMMRIISKGHTGVSATRNVGIKVAQGEYITFVDSDDLFEPGFYVHFCKQIENKPDIILEDVEGLEHDHLKSSLTNHDCLEVMKINLRFGEISMSWGIGSRIYRRSFLLENQLLFDSTIVVSEDMLFIMSAISKAGSLLISTQHFYYLQESHTLFRFNSQNLRSELSFRKKVQSLMQGYYNDPLARDINNRTKITGFIFLIDSYFGPLYSKNKLSLIEATNEIKSISEKYFYDTSFSEKKFDKFLSRKAPLYRRLLRRRQYSLVLFLNKFIDKLTGIDRWQ